MSSKTIFFNHSITGGFLLLAGILLSQCQKKENLENPNIIFILADDMGYGDPECYNPDSKIPTPHINSLANEGMQFTNFHSTATWSVPARYSLLTGRYPIHINSSKAGQTALIKEGQSTIASLLKGHGYHTGMVGKWHLGFKDWDDPNFSEPLQGGPVDHGFDYYFGIPASLDGSPYLYIKNDSCVQAPTDSINGNRSEGYPYPQGALWRGGKIAPNFKHKEVLPKLTNKAVNFIKKHHQNSESPFFLYYALTAPHTPWLPTQLFQDSSQAGMYGDFVVQVDHSVGQILKILKQLKLEDNTLVFFTSDNGPEWHERNKKRFNHSATYYLRGIKRDFYEGGHRMPFLAKWPGHIKPGTKNDELFCLTDMLATFSNLMDDTLSPHLSKESSSMLPALQGNEHKTPIKEEIIIEDGAIIQGKWKFIDGPGYRWHSLKYDGSKSVRHEEGGLYNLAKDSTESNNLYTKYPKQVEKMKSVLESYSSDSNP